MHALLSAFKNAIRLTLGLESPGSKMFGGSLVMCFYRKQADLNPLGGKISWSHRLVLVQKIKIKDSCSLAHFDPSNNLGG